MTKILSTVTTAILVYIVFFGVLDTQAFRVNQTFLVDVKVHQNGKNTLLEYTIFQYFAEDSRGIFMSLPKLQDNVWTKYTVSNVNRAYLEAKCNIDIFTYLQTIDSVLVPCLRSQNLDFRPEPWDQIIEWDQMRFRIGQDDVILPQGFHVYRFTIQAEAENESRFRQTILHDWGDPVHAMRVTDTDQNTICENGSNTPCYLSDTIKRAEIELNPESEKASLWQGRFYQFRIFGVIIITIITVFFGLWSWLARDPEPVMPHNSPRFEPPKLFPWQADYLLHEGRTTLKNTLLGYLLWLNHTRYITITPPNEKVSTRYTKKTDPTVIIDKELPNTNQTGLPDIFNATVQKIARQGFKKGVLASKINPSEHTSRMNKSIGNSLGRIYKQRSMQGPAGMTFIIAVIGHLTLLFGSDFVQDTWLIGDSIVLLAVFAYIMALPNWYLLFYYWGKLTTQGIQLRDQSHQYRYYIDQAEKLKLDFANNPNTNLQHYLDTLPYAANFGLLAQFKKFIAHKIPYNLEAKGAFASYTLIRSTAFYSPPRSSSGGRSGGGFSGGGGSW